MSVYMTADLHFCHNKILEYTNRPFNNVVEMNEKLIKNWNSVVNEDDLIYVLGDFYLCRTETQKNISQRLNGHIILVRGNHDRETVTKLQHRMNIRCVSDKPIYLDSFILSHKPLNTEMLKNKNKINIHGHRHDNIKDLDKYHYCISVENTNYCPISLDEIRKRVNLK